MRFDYYSCTIDDKPERVINKLVQLGQTMEDASSIARRYHYQQGFRVLHQRKGLAATICAGGNGSRVLAFASSDNTDEFVKLVRDTWPDNHFVTRMDSAQDFVTPKSYTKLHKVTKRIAIESKLKFTSIGDELNPMQGRTQYIGAPSSAFRARLYEKGLEQFGQILERMHKQGFEMPMESFQFKTPEGHMVNPQDWVRLELQARPETEEAKLLAAHSTPEQAWGFSRWTHDLAVKAMQLKLERMYIKPHKRTDQEKAFRWMCNQYANVLLAQHNDLGDWKSVGLTIGEVIKEESERFKHGK